VYRKAIAEDRQMTAAVASGKMTRSERRERIQKLIEEIHRIEETNKAKLQQQSLDRMWKEEVQRQQDIMRRTLSPLTR
jgi:polyhydroxyalkanoate synthesis regulator phasin